MNFAKKKLYGIKSTILITGETGCGKSTLAREIHRSSARKDFEFITANLATTSESLFESELFGHRRGAFTGAITDKLGFCDLADKGTLFLDEIGELSLSSQKKLLYLLEEKKFIPVGGCKERRFEGRIIAATNQNLHLMVAKGEFRRDLYFRLRIFEYRIPSLRSDAMELKRLYTKMLYSKGITREHREWGKLEKIFSNYSWPGNIRELINCVEYYSVIGELPYWIMDKNYDSNNSVSNVDSTYNKALECFEKKFFHNVIIKNGGAINKTARIIKISKTTLITKLKKYGIDYGKLRNIEIGSEEWAA